MRTLTILTLLSVMTSHCGCSTDATPDESNAAAVSHDLPTKPDNSPFTEEDAPDFDPKLSLEWPGMPEESRRRIKPGRG